jgi:ABC-type phosphate/phosphonate transport system substrate-binding protein
LTVALISIVAAACGSSSKTASNSTTPTSAVSSGTPTTSAGTPTSSYGANTSSSFCSLARHYQSTIPNASLGTKTPADVKAIYQKLPDELRRAESEAPSAIKGDFATLVTAEEKIIGALSNAGYDYTKVSPTAFAGFATKQVAAAATHIGLYMAQACGITTGTT